MKFTDSDSNGRIWDVQLWALEGTENGEESVKLAAVTTICKSQRHLQVPSTCIPLALLRPYTFTFNPPATL